MNKHHTKIYLLCSMYFKQNDHLQSGIIPDDDLTVSDGEKDYEYEV